jgi:signal transduction histidine kinase
MTCLPIDTKSADTSLDVLLNEDFYLKDLFAQIRSHQFPTPVDGEDERLASVLHRYRYSDLAKRALRHLAIRQAAARDVATAIRRLPELRTTADQIEERGTVCRAVINQLRDRVRKQSPMSLRGSEHFIEWLSQLIGETELSIEWELTEGLPLAIKTLHSTKWIPGFKSAAYIRGHAPTKLNPAGPRWYEYAPIVSKIVTIWDHVLEIQI